MVWSFEGGWLIYDDHPTYHLRTSTRLTPREELMEWLSTAIGLEQVHSDKVVPIRGGAVGVRSKWGYVVVGEGDGMVLGCPSEQVVVVRTADCYPVALLGDGIGALLHVGWRGALRGIALKGLRFLPTSGKVLAVFGPGICGRCYEVGVEVVEALVERWQGYSGLRVVNDRYYLDIFELVSHQLMKARGNVEVIAPPMCTFESQLLPSYRRGDREERMFTFLKCKKHVS